MPCSVCQHPEVGAITAAVQRGDSLRQVESAYGVNKSSLSRHVRNCLTAVSAATTAHVPNPLTPYHDAVHRLSINAARAHDVASLQRLVVAVLQLLKQMTRAPGERAPQADEAARQWNRL